MGSGSGSIAVSVGELVEVGDDHMGAGGRERVGARAAIDADDEREPARGGRLDARDGVLDGHGAIGADAEAPRRDEEHIRCGLGGQVLLLGDDAVHSVANPTAECAGAIHVYGGDFFATERSEWIGEPPTETPFNMDRLRASFVTANRRLPGAPAV